MKKSRFSWFLVVILSIALAACMYIIILDKADLAIGFQNGPALPKPSVSPAIVTPQKSNPPAPSAPDTAALVQKNKELSAALSKAQNDLKAAKGQTVTQEQLKKTNIALAAATTAKLSSGTRLEDKVQYGLNAQEKYVYLTFDDGPSANTPGVLDTLKKNGVNATFFVQYNPNKDYYKQIAASGNTLALHTWSHDYAKVYASDDAYFADLNKISSYVKSITGITSKIVRMPGGSSNTVSRRYSVGIMKRLTKALTDRGYAYFDWNAQCMDATTPGITASQILTNIKSFTVKNGTVRPFIVLLLHNAKAEVSTRDALQSIIDYYKGLGYHFEMLTPDTPYVHQAVQN